MILQRRAIHAVSFGATSHVLGGMSIIAITPVSSGRERQDCREQQLEEAEQDRKVHQSTDAGPHRCCSRCRWLAISRG